MKKKKEHNLFQKRFNEILTLRNMKPIDVSNITGIGKNSISYYLSGTHKPKSDKLYLIAKALDVNAKWLMGYDVPMEACDFDSMIDSPKLSKEVKVIEAIQITFGKEAVELLRYFSELNEAGKLESIKRVSEMNDISKYVKK